MDDSINREDLCKDYNLMIMAVNHNKLGYKCIESHKKRQDYLCKIEQTNIFGKLYYSIRFALESNKLEN